MKRANVQEMVKIGKSNKWFHGSKFFQSGITSTCGINHARWWFHKWSSTLSDHQMKNASLTYKSSSLSNEWPMLWHRGRCPINWYQGQRSYVWYLKKLYKWCHSNNQVMSIKNARFKCQPSTPVQAFASIRSTTFMEINDKGGEIVQRYESFGRDWDLYMDMDKVGATLRNVRG